MRGPEGASVQQCTGATRHLVRLLAEVHDQVPGLLGGPLPGWIHSDAEDADAPGGVLDHGQDIGLGAIEQVGGEEVARQDRLGLGAQELRPVFSRASRSTRALMFRRVAGLPVLPRLDLAAQRRRTMSRCQRRTVSGVTSSRSAWRRAFGITGSRVASSARSAQSRFGRRGCRRCRTASWWRRIKISAIFHASSRRDSRSDEVIRVIRRKTNRRHMTGDHHGRRQGGQRCWSQPRMRFSARTGIRPRNVVRKFGVSLSGSTRNTAMIWL